MRRPVGRSPLRVLLRWFLYCSLLFVYCLLPPNYRLLGTNYGLVGPNYRLPAPNENESCLLAVLFAFQALLFRALGVVRRGGEGKVVD